MLKFLQRHIEWMVFTGGLVALAMMSPTNTAHSLCIFEWLNVPICLGEGLGHSISYVFRGEFKYALEANFMGPFAVLILGSRILLIWKELYETTDNELIGTTNV